MNCNTEVLSYGDMWMMKDYFSNTHGIKVDTKILRTKLEKNSLYCSKQQTWFHSGAKFFDVEGPVSHAI
jgi:hypothetical protein